MREKFKEIHPCYAELVKSEHFRGVTIEAYGTILQSHPKAPEKESEKAADSASAAPADDAGSKPAAKKRRRRPRRSRKKSATAPAPAEEAPIGSDPFAY